jgi:large subunit ribosomal protein L22
LARNLLGKPVTFALAVLPFYVQKPAKKILKVMKSAVANAENNYRLERANLFVKRIEVNEGPSYRRRRPRAKGRVAPIKKKTSHITVILEEKVKTQAATPKKAEVSIKKRGEKRAKIEEKSNES